MKKNPQKMYFREVFKPGNPYVALMSRREYVFQMIEMN